MALRQTQGKPPGKRGRGDRLGTRDAGLGTAIGDLGPEAEPGRGLAGPNVSERGLIRGLLGTAQPGGGEGAVHDPDVALMLRFQAGDEAAFEELVRRHQKSVFNLVRRYLSDPALAEDASQEVFLRVYRAKMSYRPAAKFSTWLYRIAVNFCLNQLRARKTEPTAAATADPPADPEVSAPDGAIHEAEIREAVRRAIEELPEAQRMAVVLARFHAMSYEEIAEAMDLSVPAVKSLLFRARENLKERLAPFVRPD